MILAIYVTFGIILIFMVGLGSTRRYISRYPWLTLSAILGRFIVRAIVFAIESPVDRSISTALNNLWLLLGLNILAIFVLFVEMLVGAKCWRLRRILKLKRQRELARNN
ncbi:MAG: hypothetical protein BGO39_05095 [Chloroflexi bacterium 54-19]|nr:MAG: hypothetical protein BGO39_05095 [Chloroflexi bacterium 54-19]